MKDKTKNKVVVILFIAIITSIFLINILFEDIDISITERRKMAKFPKMTLSTLSSGTFFDKFEDYTMDQFAGREKFRKLKAVIETKIFGKIDTNNIYIKDDIFISQEYPLNEKSVLNLTKKINDISTKYLGPTNNVYFSIVPDKNYFADETQYLKLDYSKLENIMKENINKAQYIDIFEILNLSDYYLTDNHWKQENLLGVLDKISQEMNFNNRIKAPLEVQKITKFKGALAGQLPLDSKEDTIKILTNDILQNATVYNHETKKNTSIYDFAKLDSYDKYDIYLSGATPLLTIENPEAAEDKELIVFRDSFGSSLVPLLVEAYSKITVVDTRYIHPNLLGDYINFENADVLFLYSTLIINNSSSLK